jgi:DNA-binding transcriptional LysR family regulator
VNRRSAAREFVRGGAGVALLPDYAVSEDLRRGDLVQLLPSWQEAHPRPISALYPSRNRLPTRVRMLVDCLRQSFAERV